MPASPRRKEGLTAIKGGGAPRVGTDSPFNTPSAVDIGAFHKGVSLRLGGRVTCPVSRIHTEPECNLNPGLSSLGVHPAPQTCSCLHCLSHCRHPSPSSKSSSAETQPPKSGGTPTSGGGSQTWSKAWDGDQGAETRTPTRARGPAGQRAVKGSCHQACVRA